MDKETLIILAVIASVPPSLIGIAQLIVSLRTHAAVNGMTHDRVAAAKAEGQIEERDNRRVRDDQVQARTEERADKAEARQDKIDQK